MARTRLVETVWGQPDLSATYPPIRPEKVNVSMAPGDFRDLVTNADELIGTTFILELEDEYPPLNESALIANWVKDTGEVVGNAYGTPQLVFTTLDRMAAVTEAKTDTVIERPWRTATPIA